MEFLSPILKFPQREVISTPLPRREMFLKTASFLSAFHSQEEWCGRVDRFVSMNRACVRPSISWCDPLGSLPRRWVSGTLALHVVLLQEPALPQAVGGLQLCYYGDEILRSPICQIFIPQYNCSNQADILISCYLNPVVISQLVSNPESQEEQ